MAYLMPTLSSPTISGISSSACSIWSAKSSSVNGNSVGDSAASSFEGISDGSWRIGRCAYEPISRPVPSWRSYMFVSMSRTIGNSIPFVAPANRGTGPMSIIWWIAGVNGIDGAGHAREQRAPDAAADHDRLGLDVAVGGADAADAAALGVDPGHLDVRDDRERAGGLRLLAHQRAGAQRVDDGDALRVEAADDHLLVEERHQLLDLGRRHEPHALDAPRLRRGHPAAQLLHPLLGARDLDAAGLREDVQLLVLAHAVQRQRGHLARVVDREDEVRRVAGRAARDWGAGPCPAARCRTSPAARDGRPTSCPRCPRR